MSDGEPMLLKASDIEKHYRIGRTIVPVLKGISVGVAAGEALAIVGASGAGKSTLLHILGSLDAPSAGSVHFDGQDVARLSAGRQAALRRRRIGFVFQSYHLLPELTVVENVMMPAMGSGRPAATRRRADELLEAVGLAHRRKHRPTELSGGEQQRAALARALIHEPDVVLADEPTGNLDSETGDHVLGLLFELTRNRGHALVMVTHNAAVTDRCDRVVELVDGRVAGDGPATG